MRHGLGLSPWELDCMRRGGTVVGRGTSTLICEGATPVSAPPTSTRPFFGMTWLQIAVAALLIGGITYAYWPRRAR